MTAQPGPRKRFERALESGSVILAMASAAELTNLPLEDALALVQLLAEKKDADFDRVAGRWVGRLALEKRLGLVDVQLALAAMETIRVRPDDVGAETILLELLGR